MRRRRCGEGRVGADRARREGGGRPVEQLGLAERIACAVGLDVSRSSASGIILDRKGEVLASVLTPLSFDGWRQPLDELCRALKDRADDDGVDMSYVSRIGVGLPVPVGQGTGPGTALGEDLFSTVEQIVAPYWSGSLLVDNTIRMTALAEARWGAGQGAPEQIYVHLGGGVGACVIVADRIGGGSTGYAGELGHVTVPGGTHLFTLWQTVRPACVGSGVGPTRITSSLGIMKAYTTRVGAGPFPTELFDKWGEFLQATGGEIGVNTGRKRRCGWYDSVIARYASRVNGFTDLFLTKLDVLTGIGEIPICVAYDVDGVRHDEMPLTQSEFHHAVPIYETMPAWDEDITGCRSFADLPQKAQDYVRRLEELSGCRISYIGVGPGRDQTIVLHDVMA